MHPELLRALAEARHEDLLGTRQPRRQSKIRSDQNSLRVPRSRRRVGSMLIWLANV
jgi:hypothetical protein